MYACANGGYHLDIERIYLNMPGGFVAEASLTAEITAHADHYFGPSG
jgi:hypothetical protein